MIAFVRGTVAQVGLSSVVVDIGGVGLEVNCTPGTIATLREGTTAHLPIRRLNKPGMRAVFAYSADLDDWLRDQSPSPADTPRTEALIVPRHRPLHAIPPARRPARHSPDPTT